ncbi:MAG TPA: thymidine phosphorylase family protein [Bacteroidia bacterium]|jgi:thymidine phosphorylase|nr:thymidine phosphorylase family protein [Bacteroidia bacterium]
MSNHKHTLTIKDLGIDTYRENILFIRADSHVCRSEGFTALTRVMIHKNGHTIVATLNVVTSNLLKDREASLSQEAMKRLQVQEGDTIAISHLQPLKSLSYVRAKMYNEPLDEHAFTEITKDVVAGHYSNIEIAAFVTACAGNNLSLAEITALTKAMIAVGKKIDWGKDLILDKHCVGGLPGNRTTPIVVSIIAAAGLTIPKTSSRAITSPAGTADTMETMTPVNLSISEIQRVVKKEGGCFAWGGAVKLSPADDLLIAVEKALEIDSEGQMVASVLSKKVAAGSTHVLIDIPVGPTAKVRSNEEALRLQYYFTAVSETIGIHTEVLITNGTQPVGKGIGPSLEAMDVLAVLRNLPDAVPDLKERAIGIAAALLKLSGKYAVGKERDTAIAILESGQAYKKFLAICEAQGGFKEPVFAKHHFDVLSTKDGIVKSVDNRKLARIAKLAGAPKVATAGVVYHAVLGKMIKKNDVLLSIYAESEGELEYAKEYLLNLTDLIEIN